MNIAELCSFEAIVSEINNIANENYLLSRIRTEE